MKSLLALLPLLALSGCAVHPGIYNRDTGEHIFLGGSIGTKTEKESAMAMSANGTMIAYGMTGSDQTLIPKGYFAWQTIGELATAARQAFSSANVTRRALGAQSVRKVAIRADRAVQLKALDAVVPEATLLPAP